MPSNQWKYNSFEAFKVGEQIETDYFKSGFSHIIDGGKSELGSPNRRLLYSITKTKFRTSLLETIFN